jgi:dolichol-phosphate mannosyltransferase
MTIGVVLAVSLLVSNFSVYTPLIAAMFFLAGLQMICLGAVAEYIGRIYDEVRRRPLSIIRKVYGREARERYQPQYQSEEPLKVA